MVGREWINAVAEKIAVLESQPPGEDRAVALASLYVLHDHFSDVGRSSDALTVENEETASIPEKNRSLPSSPFELARSLAEDELSDADKYHGMGEDGIARDELRHAKYFIEKLRELARSPYDLAAAEDLQARHDVMAQGMG